MAKFSLLVPYAPNYQDNRNRKPDEQFIVRFLDFSIEERIKNAETFDTSVPLPKVADKDNPTEEENVARSKAMLARTGWLRDFGAKRVKRVENLVLTDVEGESEKEVIVSTGELLLKYLPDVMAEVGARILFGPSPDELKNSPSPSSAASSQTK